MATAMAKASITISRCMTLELNLEFRMKIKILRHHHDLMEYFLKLFGLTSSQAYIIFYANFFPRKLFLFLIRDLEKNAIPIFRFSIKLLTRNSWHRFSFFEGVKKYVVNATCIKDFVVFAMTIYICTPELTAAMSRQKKNIFEKSTFLAKKYQKG